MGAPAQAASRPGVLGSTGSYLKDMALKSVSLKLLPVLQALLKHQSVTGASRALCVSPSSVSESLARLRETLGDALLVRVGSRMQLTSRAQELIGPLEELCASIDQFFERGAFEPRSARRTFVIATSDILAYDFAPELLRVVRSTAPGIRFHLVDVGRELTSLLAERQVDFALLPAFALGDLAPSPLRFRQLDQRSRVVLMCKTHPLAGKQRLDNADVLAYQHAAFSPDPVMVGAHSIIQLATGEPLDVAVRTPFMTLVPHLLAGTDLLAIVDHSLAREASAHLPLTFRPLESETESTQVGLVWSPVQDGDLAHEWLRTEVADEVERELAQRSAQPLLARQARLVAASPAPKRAAVTASSAAAPRRRQGR
jgi:DNA-binding transcriptional LysR family regulator